MTEQKEITLHLISSNDRQAYLDLLLMADESESIVMRYINDGDLFAVHYNDSIVGVVLFTFHPGQIIELKNIALQPPYRQKGLGKIILLRSFELYKSKGYKKMIVGTSNSGIGAITFYQKVGFRMYEVRRNFFLNYPTVIFEDGIRALDMIMFERDL